MFGIDVVVGTIMPAMIGDAAAARYFKLSLANEPMALGLAVAALKPEDTA